MAESPPTGGGSRHALILMPSGRRAAVEEGQTILAAATGMGIAIESLCGGQGTCGKCQVVIEEGRFSKHGIQSSSSHLSPLTGQEKILLDQELPGPRRLACSAHINGDLLISVPEESRAQKQVIRKAATERAIPVDPVISQEYLQVEPARLGDHRGDWGRLQDALALHNSLTGLQIDLQALKKLQPALREEEGWITVTIWGKSQVIDIRPGYQEGIYGLGVDVGSTSVAAYLADLRTGDILASASAMNPQVSYGEDLMSRISYCQSRPEGLETLNRAIIKTINTLAADCARQAGIRARHIHEIVLAGNTTMTHILLGISPRELGEAPFALAIQNSLDLLASQLGLRLHPAARAHILPAQAGHVGGDNVAVLIAEQPYLQEETILVVDLGTNAEIVLSHQGQLYSASSPTGPAFEGGQISSGMRAAPGAVERVRIDPATGRPRFQVIGEERWSDHWGPGQETRHLAAGICGSGIIEAVAELFLAGLISSDGRFNPAHSSTYMHWDDARRKGAYCLADEGQTASGEPLLITQEDIRSIQLAKAALYAGARLLMLQAGINQVDQIRLAGAFGSYINPRHALILGLIPDCSPDQIHSVGNAAGDGARLAVLNQGLREEASRIARQVRYLETAIHPDFQHQFVQAMHLPHQSDPFPSLKETLAAIPAPSRPARKRRFPRS